MLYDAVNEDASFVRSMHARQALDQRRLPGPVFTDQAVDFTGFDVQLHVAQRLDTRKDFCHVL